MAGDEKTTKNEEMTMTTINDTNVAVQSEVMENDYALVLPGN